MIMSSERGSMSLSQLCESSSLSFLPCSLVLLLSLVFLSTFSALSLSHSLSPAHAPLSLSFSLSVSLSPPSFPSLFFSPAYWKDPGQITKKAIFIYELQDLIDTYFMPSKSTLYYCCLCDLFILLWNIPSVEGGKCTGCNSPWTSIILDFSTGWSSMQKGHFLSTKIKTIMMIKKTCVLFVLV